MAVYVRVARAIRQPRPIGGGICEVDLSRGLVSIVDEADTEMVSVCSWHANFNGQGPNAYAKGLVPGRKTLCAMHRYLMGFPDCPIDHVNQITIDNRRANLRIATATLNNANRSMRRDSTTGYKGVGRARSKYSASVYLKGVRIYYATFDTPIEAALAYDAAALATFGEFARTNAALGLIQPTPNPQKHVEVRA
jgi:hypothetical protein